jgi:hypothetical protein
LHTEVKKGEKTHHVFGQVAAPPENLAAVTPFTETFRFAQLSSAYD